MVDNGGLKNMIQLFLRISLYIYFQENKLSMISFKLKTQGSKKKKKPRDQTQVSRIAGRFFTSWATREAPN